MVLAKSGMNSWERKEERKFFFLCLANLNGEKLSFDCFLLTSNEII